MSKLKIAYAQTHGVLFVPDVGQLGPTLTNKSSAVSKACEMYLEDNMLYVLVENKNKKQIEILVPIVNCSHMVAVKE